MEGEEHINQNQMEQKHMDGGKSRVKQREQSHLGHKQVLTRAAPLTMADLKVSSSGTPPPPVINLVSAAV